jgi:hypothetical protein
MIIQRRYEPDPETLELLADVLYSLLVETPDSHAETWRISQSGAHPAPGVPGNPE